MKETILKEIQLFISREYGISEEKISLESNFQEDLGLDSLEVMEMVFEIEDKYGLDLTCNPQEVGTVGNLVEILTKCVDNKKIAL